MRRITNPPTLALLAALGLLFPFPLYAQDTLRVPEWMVYVEGGEFVMGSPEGEEARSFDEGPRHSVVLSSFLIAKREVSFDEYDEFCSATGRALVHDRGWGRWSRPAINLSWWDAVEYCNWRSKKEGLPPAYSLDGSTVICDWESDGYRLPTEAEWEYAARGGKLSRGFRYSGGDDPDAVAWHTLNSDNRTHPTGGKTPNELGLYDMSGNLWEWCWDWYAGYSRESVRDPRGPALAALKVVRGGAWFNVASNLRPAKRYFVDPSYKYDYLGFRLARSVPVKR